MIGDGGQAGLVYVELTRAREKRDHVSRADRRLWFDECSGGQVPFPNGEWSRQDALVPGAGPSAIVQNLSA